MNQDNSVQGILFRLRRGIGNPDTELRRHNAYALQLRGNPTIPGTGKVATSLGKRNGVPDGGDQDVYQLQRQIMRRGTTRPFRTDQMRDIVPTIYNGNVNILAETGGAPLAFALDDESELEQRLYSEGIRGSIANPLSARFAFNTRQNRELPVQGGATDVLRQELTANEDDLETKGRKMKSGYLGKYNPHSSAETPLDPEIEDFVSQSRPPTQRDIKNMGGNFTASVTKLGKDQVTNLKSIQSQLAGISTDHGMHLQNIYQTLSDHGGKFDALLVASQSQQAGVPQSSSTGIPTPPGHQTPLAATSSSISTGLSPEKQLRISSRLAERERKRKAEGSFTPRKV
jgi:DNA-binding phage protein